MTWHHDVLPTKNATVKWDEFILGLKSTTKEFIENVLQNIIESIVVTDLSGKLVFFNNYSEEMFGYSAHEVLGRHIVALGAREPDVMSRIRDNLPFDGEVTLKRKNGARFPAYVRCAPLRDETGQPVAMVGVAVDLTDEKEKERIAREVARLKEFNENIIASLNDGILILDLKGVVSFVNRRMEALLEYKNRALLGRNCSDLMSSEGRSQLQEVIAGKTAKAGATTFEANWITRSGNKLPTLVSASPLKEGEALTGIIAAVTDLSELRNLKEELFQSEKMSLVGTLASEVAHEINNPLGGLIVAVQMLLSDLQEGNFDPEVFLEELKDIEKDAKRCRKITRQLLDFSRPVPVEKKSLDLNEVIEDAISLVQRQIELDDIIFFKEYDKSLPLIKANTTGLQQVIINLVKNAHDAMPQGGQVTITTEAVRDEEADWAKISVDDSGPGVPESIQDSLFNPFLTTKGKGRGTGLGLAVSKRIVEEFGGRIGFYNKPKGGSVFQVMFPFT